MKNTLMFLLVSLLLAFSLTACGGDSQTNGTTGSNGAVTGNNGTTGSNSAVTGNNGTTGSNSAATGNNGTTGSNSTTGSGLMDDAGDALDDAGRAVRNSVDAAARNF